MACQILKSSNLCTDFSLTNTHLDIKYIKTENLILLKYPKSAEKTDFTVMGLTCHTCNRW